MLNWANWHCHLKNSICFYCMFCVIIHLHCKALSCQMIGQQHFTESEQKVQLHLFFWIHSGTSMSSLVIKDPWPSFAGSHTCTSPPCLTDNVERFGSWALPFFFHTFPFPSFYYKWILVSFVQRILFQNEAGCLAKSNLAFLFWRVTSGLHLDKFTSMKMSLDCRQWLAYLVKGVPDLPRWSQKKNSVILLFSCFPWNYFLVLLGLPLKKPS